MSKAADERGSRQMQPFVAVYHPASHQELAFVKHALQELGVPYYIKNELATLGSVSAIGCDEMTVMVAADRAAECREAIKEYLSKQD